MGGKMELKLQTQKQKSNKHKKCPACGCTHLIEFNVDQFCSRCDWDSLLSYVQSGRMNNLSKAVREHGFKQPQSAHNISTKEEEFSEELSA